MKQVTVFPPFYNKNFLSLTCAKQYFNNHCQVSYPFSIFLIEDHEDDVYSVVSERMLDHLQNEFYLDMTILQES